jgi:putative membrane protein
MKASSSFPSSRPPFIEVEDNFRETTNMTDQTEQNPSLLDIATRLAFDRTRLAYDRTLMARVRTATALITFGFTVYKFFQIEIGKTDPIDSIIGPREFALTMISIGLASLLIPEEPPSLAAALAGLVAILGTLALIAVIFRH